MAKTKKPTGPKKSPTADKLGLSIAATPLERLCDDATSLGRTTWILFDMIRDGREIDAWFTERLARHCAKLRAVSTHEDAQWNQLGAANPNGMISIASMHGHSYTEVALRLGRHLYEILLEAESGRDAVWEWMTPTFGECRDLHIEKLKLNWREFLTKATPLPEFDSDLLAGEIFKEFWRASKAPPEDASGSMAKSQSAPGDLLEKIALATMDESTGQIVRIAQIRARAADDRMREICELDARMYGKDSPYWADLLDVTDAAIRKTTFWKVDRKKARESARETFRESHHADDLPERFDDAD